MVFWNAQHIKSLAYFIKDCTDSIGWKINWGLEKLLSQLKENTGEGTKENPACPFAKSDLRHEWIDEVFDFIKKKVIPKMQEHYWDSMFEWERFWCGKKIWQGDE